MKRSKGSITLEALLLVPALFIFSTFIIYAGRMTDAAIAVRHTADMAARVASQSSAQNAEYRALQTARYELASVRTGCEDADVRLVKRVRRGETIFVVRVQCSVNSRGLGLLALAPKHVSAESSEIVDVYTSR